MQAQSLIYWITYRLKTNWKLMLRKPYSDFLQYARRMTKRADEAEDLLQNALLAAIEAGRNDMTCVKNRRWLIGTIRKRALFEARSAARQRQRETTNTEQNKVVSEKGSLPKHFIGTLSPSLRTTALLAITGHTRAEISWLLRISDCALRQRIAGIKRHWLNYDKHNYLETQGLLGPLLFGQIRQSLIKPVRNNNGFLASHDPDGNLFILSSQNLMVRQHKGK